MTTPAPPAPVERKVKAATAAAGTTAGAVSAAVLALLTYLWPHMDAGYKFEIAAAAPGALAAAGAFLAGYKARHTPRPVPDSAQEIRELRAALTELAPTPDQPVPPPPAA